MLRQRCWDIAHRKAEKLDLPPNRAAESFWDAMWLGIRPFFCFCHVTYKLKQHVILIGSRHCRRFQIVENSITFPTNPSRASGTPCGSVLGRFCVFGHQPLNPSATTQISVRYSGASLPYESKSCLCVVLGGH